MENNLHQEMPELETAVDSLFDPSAGTPAFADWEACCSRWGYVPVLQVLAQKYPNLSPSALDFFYRKLQLPEFSPEKPVKTIALLFSNMRLGGTERIMSLQMKMFTDMGLRVVLLNDMPPEEKEYPVPDSVRRIMIPHRKEGRDIRLSALIEVLKKESVDLLYLHAPQDYYFDILACRLGVGIPCICHFHFNFTYKLAAGNQYAAFNRILPANRLCNLVICLSRVNEAFFRIGGCNALFLPNPPTFSVAEIIKHQPTETPRTVLWLARICRPKNPLAAVKIMQQVLEAVPDAKLLMVGKAEPDAVYLEKELLEFVRCNQLEDRILMTGGTDDPKSFYQQADLFLSTSVSEGFPCTIGESLAHGLPVVAFDLPYLEFLRESGNGIRVVPQNDIHGAAKMIIELLTDPESYRKLSGQALRSAEKYDRFDFPAAWRNILASLGQPEKYCSVNIEDDESIRLMLEQLVSQSVASMRSLDDAQRKRQEKELERQKQELERKNKILKRQKKELEAMKKSLSYRLGRALTWLPRKIRGGIRCLKENGFRYTCRRLLQKLHLQGN